MRPRKLRVARPSDDLEALRRFYAEGLGLNELGGFQGHAGYDGLFFGADDQPWELEFTRHEDGSPAPEPNRDNLLVLYLEDRAAVDAIAERMKAIGVEPCAPENPYWIDRSLTFEDPDGWRVVVFDSQSLEA